MNSQFLSHNKFMQLAAIDRPSVKGSKPMPVSEVKPVRCVEFDRQYTSAGIMFEPLKGRRMFFYYAVVRWGDADDSELVIITDTHRVVVRGCRLGSLADGVPGTKDQVGTRRFQCGTDVGPGRRIGHSDC